MKKKWMAGVLVLGILAAGCGQKTPETADTQSGYRNDRAPMELVQAVAQELGDEYWADMEVPAEALETMYGVTSDLYEDYYGQIPMISAHADSLLIVKAAQGKEAQVEEALGAYQENLQQDTFQYPANLSKIQASQLQTYGSYVCFVQLGGSMEGTDGEAEKEVTACQEANERALEVIRKELTQ